MKKKTVLPVASLLAYQDQGLYKIIEKITKIHLA